MANLHNKGNDVFKPYVLFSQNSSQQQRKLYENIYKKKRSMKSAYDFLIAEQASKAHRAKLASKKYQNTSKILKASDPTEERKVGIKI
jgi:FixJ family two-component response regulator